MEDETDGLFYLGAGPLAAILLGAALIPVREYTPAANLSFAFMALTIVIAEFGGRWAALTTALASALSLDFFLTQPYLRLSIDDKHDVIAFVGLALCGVLAGALASQRGARIAELTAARKHGDLLRSALREWDPTAPAEPQLTELLRASCKALPLAGAVIRNDRDRVEASASQADGLRTVPETVLQLDALPHLPESGGRIALSCGERSLGWLDLWGNGAPTSAASRQALSDLARLVALLLASAPR
jgi:hypothetical protein